MSHVRDFIRVDINVFQDIASVLICPSACLEGKEKVVSFLLAVIPYETISSSGRRDSVQFCSVTMGKTDYGTLLSFHCSEKAVFDILLSKTVLKTKEKAL